MVTHCHAPVRTRHCSCPRQMLASIFAIGDFGHENELPCPLPPSILMHASYIWQTVQNVSTCTSLMLGALSHQRTQALSLQSLLTRLMYLYLRIALRSTWGMMHDGSLLRLLAVHSGGQRSSPRCGFRGASACIVSDL